MSLRTVQARRSTLIPPVLRFLHDRNPFYLLSALCMFVGLRVVIAAADSAAGDGRTLVGLIATMQVYEAALIGLALALIVGRGLRRDGWILLGIESLFLVDGSNLFAELSTASLKPGVIVGLAWLLLAVAKVAVVLRVLRVRMAPATAAYMAVQMAVLLALPVVFRGMQSPAATVSAGQVYGVWWAVGLLMVAGAVMVRRDVRNVGHPFAAGPVALYVGVPLVSLLVHLAGENRVYWVHFQPANIGPVLLASAVALQRLRPSPRRLGWSLSLVAIAVVASITPAEYRADLTGRLLGIGVSPLRLALVGGGAVTVGLAVRYRSLLLAGVVLAAAGVAALGSDVPEMMRRLSSAEDRVWDLVPTTPMAWGYTAIAGAFVLLGIGAVLGLNARTSPGDRPTGGMAPPPGPFNPGPGPA